MLLPFRQSSNLTRLQRVITSEIMKVLLQKIILGSVLSVYWYGRPLDWKSHHWDNGLFGENFYGFENFLGYELNEVLQGRETLRELKHGRLANRWLCKHLVLVVS